MSQQAIPASLPALLTGLGGFVDQFSGYIVQWALRKKFREACANCDGKGYEAFGPIGTEVCDLCKGTGCQPNSRNFGEQIALIQSEIDELEEKAPEAYKEATVFLKDLRFLNGRLSKILEDHRSQKPGTPPVMDQHCPEFTNVEIEAADIFIRMADMAGAYQWRLGAAIKAKQLYNETRPEKHGKRY